MKFSRPNTITIHCNMDQKQYFFSSDHCQAFRSFESYPKGFVAMTFNLPISIVPRPEFPSGKLQTVKELIEVFFCGETEIPNPDPAFQP